MASINNEASNTQKMREHMSKKLSQLQATSLEETDLVMCSRVVNLSNSIALNHNVNYSDLVNVMLANPNDYSLVSDVDQQLLLKVNFKDPVTCTSVCFRAEIPPVSSDGSLDPSDCSGPKTVKCFANLEDLDFVDTENVSASQIIELTQQHLKGEKIPLRGNRFSRCHSIQFFIEDNQDSTQFTFLNRLCLWGRIAAPYQVEF